jgi:hypothetical protein
LYAAHQTYGQAISDFCERAIRMKQFVGGGETFHLLEGMLVLTSIPEDANLVFQVPLTSSRNINLMHHLSCHLLGMYYQINSRNTKYFSSRCHGHLLYEGYVDREGGKMWGAVRGGETAIRNGDIVQWCNATFNIQDDDEYTTVLSVGEEGL